MRKRYEVEFQQKGNNVITYITDVLEKMVIHEFTIYNAAMSQENSSIGFDNCIEVADYIEMKFGNVDYYYT